MTRPIPKVYTTRFFQLITARQFAEAERILERVKQKMHVSERNLGYFQALYGLLLTQKNNSDRYAFLANIDLTDTKQLRKYRQEFLFHVDNRLHAEYDRGFFAAWADYMRILPKIQSPPPVSTTVKNALEQEETPVEQEQEKQTKS